MTRWKVWRVLRPSRAKTMRTAIAGLASPSRSEHRSLEMRSGSIGTTRSGKYVELPRIRASESMAEPART